MGWWPTTFVAPALLLAALDVDARAARSSRRRPRAGRLGLLFGACAFGPMLTWLIMPAGYVGWFLLVAIQAAWLGLLALLLGRVLDRWWLAPAAAVLWTGIDAWRAIVPLNGFEWGAIAYAHVEGSWLLPIARLVGGRGITLMVVLISALAFEVVRRTVQVLGAREGGSFEDALRPTQAVVGALVAALLVSVMATIEPPAEAGSMDVLAVQGNDIRHWESPDADPPLRITTAMRDLTLEAVEDDPDPDLVVWPESSIDRGLYSDEGADLHALVEDTVEQVPRLLAGANLDGEDPEREWYNTALIFEGELPHEDAYVKHRLVPFGEYVPFREYLDWFPPLDQVPRDGQSGPRGQNVRIGDVEAAVIICFETLFASVTHDNVVGTDATAEILIVLTNNASFGDSAQPAQHLAQTRLRAVETGRWAVHGALSGASAFVDPHGGSHAVTEPFELATIRDQVPLVQGLTPFLVIGDLVGVLTRAAVAGALLVLLGLAGLRRRRDRRPRDSSGPSGRLPRSEAASAATGPHRPAV